MKEQWHIVTIWVTKFSFLLRAKQQWCFSCYFKQQQSSYNLPVFKAGHINSGSDSVTDGMHMR